MRLHVYLPCLPTQRAWGSARLESTIHATDEMAVQATAYDRGHRGGVKKIDSARTGTVSDAVLQIAKRRLQSLASSTRFSASCSVGASLVSSKGSLRQGSMFSEWLRAYTLTRALSGRAIMDDGWA